MIGNWAQHLKSLVASSDLPLALCGRWRTRGSAWHRTTCLPAPNPSVVVCVGFELSGGGLLYAKGSIESPSYRLVELGTSKQCVPYNDSRHGAVMAPSMSDDTSGVGQYLCRELYNQSDLTLNTERTVTLRSPCNTCGPSPAMEDAH